MATRTSEKRAQLLEKVNGLAKSDLAKWTFEQETPFGVGEGAENVLRYRLGNGLTLLLLVDASAPVVSYFTWYNVGSRHEKKGKTGLAHLFEHLMFNESEGLPAGEFDRKLEENGAESNAATWVDWTYYYESLPADRFGLAVTLESNRMANLILREPQVVSEKEVVANERRMRVDDDVEGAINELLYKTAFTVHPYHWPTIGWMDDIQAFTPEDCDAFYKTFYSPNNATVIVVGDVKEADVLGKIAAAYGEIPAATLPVEDTVPEPPQMEERVVSVSKPTATEKLMLGYHGPAFGDGDHVVLTVLNEVLFGGRASRLHRKLVTEGELATDLRGWVSTFRDSGLYEMYATARSGKTADELLKVIETEIALVCTEPIGDAELARAKARLELSALQGMDTTSGKAEQIGFHAVVLGDVNAPFRRLEAYRRVTAGEIRRAARQYLVPRARTRIHVLPEAGAPESGEADATEAAAQ